MLFKKFRKEERNKIIEKELDKEKFYNSIQPYVDAGLVREVAALDNCSLLCLCEKVYVACPYVVSKGNYAVGYIMTNEENVKYIVNNDSRIYSFIDKVINRKEYRSLLCMFDPEMMNLWVKYCDSLKSVNVVNPEFEAELTAKSKKM